jgi:hypothetical protein
MKLDPGMHIVMHLVFFGKTGVTCLDPEAAYSEEVVRRLVPGPGGRLRRRGLDVAA